MNMKILILILLAVAHTASARFVTLVAGYENPTNEVQIAAGEVAELRGYSAYVTYNAEPPFSITLTKDGVDLPLLVSPIWGYGNLTSPRASEHVFTGPARIRFAVKERIWAVGYYCTFLITPEAFPPDRTLIVTPGTNQTRITLECSTNLLNWFTATNGIYGPLPEAKFFRIKTEPVQ